LCGGTCHEVSRSRAHRLRRWLGIHADEPGTQRERGIGGEDGVAEPQTHQDLETCSFRHTDGCKPSQIDLESQCNPYSKAKSCRKKIEIIFLYN
jgi:hypothetical protein